MSQVAGFVVWVIIYVAAMCVVKRIYGTGDMLGVLMVFCRKSKYLKFLIYSFWGDDTWYWDIVEKQMAERRDARSRN